MKNIPERMCVVTHNKLPKQEMLRIVKNKDGVIFVDPTGKANGKGAYISKNSETLELAMKSKVLNKVFNTEVPDSLYEEIKNNL